MNKILILIVSLCISISLVLHINNISLFNPLRGFDGDGHIEYIQYLTTNHSIPLPHRGWEFNQPPLYYLLSAMVTAIGLSPQLINLSVYFLLAFLLFRFTKSKLAVLAFLALPMVNYFPPLITNEFLSGFWIVLTLLLLLYKPDLKLIILVLVLGFYTKYTDLTILPIIPIAFYLHTRDLKVSLEKTFSCFLLFFVLISPILIRNVTLYHKILPLAPDFYQFNSPVMDRSLSFYTRMDWIPKGDIYGADVYSFWGGMWNTFWHDGESVITPVVEFHKKPFLLWLLGFPLTIISIMGLVKMYATDRNKAIILYSYVFVAILSLIKYTLDLPFDFVLKAFYAFGLIVPYVLGLVEASKQKVIRIPVIALLSIQFATMVSWFLIQPWWHVAK